MKYRIKRSKLYYDEYFKKLLRPQDYLQGSTFEPANIMQGKW